MKNEWQPFYSIGPLGHGKEYFWGNKKLQDVLQECDIFDVHWDWGPGSFAHWATCLIWIKKRAGYQYIYAMDERGNAFMLPITGEFRPNLNSEIAPLLRKMKRVEYLKAKKAKILSKLALIQKELAELKK